MDDNAVPGPAPPPIPPCVPPECIPGGRANVTIDIADLKLGISGAVKVRDVWNKKDLVRVNSNRPFILQNDHFVKTGSGQAQAKLRKRGVFCRVWQPGASFQLACRTTAPFSSSSCRRQTRHGRCLSSSRPGWTSPPRPRRRNSSIAHQCILHDHASVLGLVVLGTAHNVVPGVQVITGLRLRME